MEAHLNSFKKDRISYFSPQSSKQWASCHPERVLRQKLVAPLEQRTLWALHNLWSPNKNTGQKDGSRVKDILVKMRVSLMLELDFSVFNYFNGGISNNILTSI